MRKTVLIVLCLLALVAGVWLFWPRGGDASSPGKNAAAHGDGGVAATVPAATNATKTFSTLNLTNPLAFRLTNTAQSLRQLAAKPHAILLQNALIDTDARLNLDIPSHLKAAGKPGAYIVQARGVVDVRFRALLAGTGASVVSYIPNNAYLVNATVAQAGALAGSPLVQVVLPFEPYYKLQPALLGIAVAQKPLPPGTLLTLGLFSSGAADTEAQIEKMGGAILARDRSPFGSVVRVQPPTNWIALGQLPGVQIIEPARERKAANDLSRVTLGVTPDTTSGITNDWLGLTGANVIVGVVDSGVDATHLDFTTGGNPTTVGGAPVRVLGLTANDLVDTSGHGTHVAGIIAGNGSKSLTVGSGARGSVTNADFRGKAPMATLFSMRRGAYSESELQEMVALTNALISNNSWNNGASAYDLTAASYDAATRDAVPGLTGSQPVLFVFSAGNGGGGDDALGSGGNPDSVESPGTAKNVITVGALEQLRNITNIVTTVLNGVTNKTQPWKDMTSTSYLVPGYSARGNVGIGTEGTYGRFKPDVVAPGTFVVSTRSSQWDTNAFLNPTNYASATYYFQTVAVGALNASYSVFVPQNAVGVTIQVLQNVQSASPFPTNVPVYVSLSGAPATNSYDILTTVNGVSIPPDNGGAIAGIQSLLGNTVYFAVGDSGATPLNYNLQVTVITTNNSGDYYQQLLGLDDNLGPYYRYDWGTSMAAADASGVLALMQDYFTNTLKLTPSPALLKAMLINGARPTSSYDFQVQNDINYQGWGLINLPNSIPASLTNSAAGSKAFFFLDQSPTNALATGDSRTYNIAVSSGASALPLRVTLVWTDPPGNPAAAIKLVNNLDLVVTNLDDPANPLIFYGNDIPANSIYNSPTDTNSPPNLDTINNVENVFLPPDVGTNFSITVIGRAVNVNAVTAHTNDIVQDFALVISCGDGSNTNGFTLTSSSAAANPTSGQRITFVIATNSPLMNQFVGASSPLLGTNNVPLGTNTVWGPNGVVTIGMTNQWHFYVVTNTGPAADFTNASFITFLSPTLSVPREGVLNPLGAANATRPEADIDLYVTTDSSLTNLNPAAIVNCLAGSANSGASLGQGGTEFVYFNNSTPGEVYYVGVKSEDQMASEYAFLAEFSNIPPSETDKNGNVYVHFSQVDIPDGDAVHPGFTNLIGLCIQPITVNRVIVTNILAQQNAGDLVVALNHSAGGGNGGAGLVYHNSPNDPGTYTLIYDDSTQGGVAGSQPSAGPGSLKNFQTHSGQGVWMFHAADNAPAFIGSLSGEMKIEPHRNLTGGAVTVTVPANGWFIDYVDVPPGYTNLTFYGTNLPPTAVPPIQMYEKLGNEPTLADYDQRADLTNGVPPGNTISVGPPLNLGRYFIGLYNPSASDVTVLLSATLGYGSGANNEFSYASDAPTTLLDDAVSPSTITVPNTVTQLVSSVSVGLVVNSPRISDYTFTLVSPTGQRVLLMENRGGTDTNGAGSVFLYTNVVNSKATGNAAANTNYLAVDPLGGTIPIKYNFYYVVDQMTVYDTTNANLFDPNGSHLLLNTGFTNNGPQSGPWPWITVNVPYPLGVSNITIIMNQFGNTNGTGGDAWDYTAGAPMTNYEYLVFTDDTNLANVPIKFAQPPFSFTELSSNFTLSDFELATNGDYFAPTNIYDLYGGWNMPTNLVTVSTVFDFTNNVFVQVTNVVVYASNEVSVVTDPSDSIGDNVGTNLLALANGTITRDIATVPGRIYNVTFWYRGPGIASWWRGEGDAIDSSDPEKNGNNGTLVGRFNFPAGEVGQAFGFEDVGEQFEFAGTNTYVQIRQSAALDVGQGGGFTVEGWINPTNVAHPQPLVEWLAKVPTNTADTNFNRLAGPYLDRATGHYYYLLGATNWTTSERWATNLGGHLATVNTANEQNWIFDNFANYGSTNHNLWIGLTNNTVSQGIPGIFRWSSGQTNSYTNWMAGQPLNTDSTRKYTFIRGATNLPSGLWVCANNSGVVQGSAATMTNVYGVVEVDNLQTNGVQLWMSVTNSMPGGTNALISTNGCLYANLIDTSNVWHEVYSAPGLIQSNVFQHVALTFDTNSGLAKLYLNGTNVATTNLFMVGSVFTPFVPRTDGDVLLGRDMTLCTNNYFGGEMDEMSIYKRALSGAEIAAIYRVSTTDSNGLTGKFDASVTPASGLAEAEVVFGTTSNLIFGVNNQWEQNSYTFTATSNTMPLRITGVEPGILLDSFAVSQAPLTNLCYLPEQSLNDALTGSQANGNWQLQVWDNRVGAYITNSSLVSWQLNFILASNSMVAASLSPQTPTAGTVGPGQTVYYSVNVPSWAQWATNILVSSDLPVDLLFNPTNLPTGSNPGDQTLLTASLGGIPAGISTALAVNTNAPFAPYQAGTTYYLGVRNSGTHAASVVLEVDYDLTALTNGIPYTSSLNTNEAVRYFSYVVSSNAYAATFQLLNLTNGNADLVLRKGVPLPTLLDSDYGSFNATNADENIYVLTNSAPVPLSAGTWYLGVIRRSTGPVGYTVLAKELDNTNTAPGSIDGATIIELTNAVPVKFTAGPGAALTNFFHFAVTNMIVNGVTNCGLRFELYNLSGNGDLTVQTNALPLAPPFFQSSQNPGRSPEMIAVFTNNELTNLTADWYLGVPNHELTNITYTIVAVVDTNAYFPAFPGAAGAGGGAVGAGHAGVSSTVYHVFNLADSGYGSLRDAVSSTNRTVVFDVSGSINLLTPLVITNSNLTIAGQTAPGGGITVAGQMTTLQAAHDVILRNVRFRRGSVDDSLMLTNVNTVIADHVSAAWSDTVLSTLNSSNVTVQWSIMADSLYMTNNPAPLGSLLRYGSGALSFHHNLYADNYSGSPRLGDNLTLDFVNNVIYNWGVFSGLSGGTNDLAANPNGCTNQLNYVCNYLIAGPDTARFATNYASTNIAFFGGVTNSQFANWVFQTNNFIDSDTNKVLNGGDTQWAMFTNKYTKFNQPFPVISVPTDEAFMAYEKVLAFAGVNMSLRDAVDTNIVNKVRTQTGTLISNSPLSGAVAMWKGENNALDSVGTNNGTLINGATFTNGMVGNAFRLNVNNSNYVAVPDAPALNPTNAITIECWLYRNSQVGSFDPIVKKSDISNANGYAFEFNDNHLLFWVYRTAGGWINSGGSVPISLGQWYHVAGVYDGSRLLCYTNGRLASASVVSGNISISTNYLGIGNDPGNPTTRSFNGLLDEVSIYKRALSSSEIQSIYTAGSAGKFAQSATGQPYLDTDQDGIPDFWEATFTPANVLVPSNNNDRDGDGYTDLEEYINWQAVPHALTVTNTSVGIDLYQMSGNSGHLAFFLTNAVNGTVYLTNVLGSVTNTGPLSNSIAIFTPTNTSPAFSGYASFGYYVTNTDTMGYFGPVTVSVVVSAVPVTYGLNTNLPPTFLTNAPPNQTNNELTLLTVTNTATDANTNVTLSYTVTMSIDTNAMNLLGWVNPFANTTNTTPVISTNGVITWTPSEAQGPGVYILTTVVSDNGTPALTTGNRFSVTVNEVNTAPFWPTNVPSQTNYTIPALNLLVVTNTALDADLPVNPLTYQLFVSPAVTNAVIDTNGIIVWTPTVAQVGLYTFTTIVTDTNQYAVNAKSLSATNTFTVNVPPVAAPFVFTQPAQAVTGAGAQLNGMVTPNGRPTTAWFQWGTSTDYGSNTPPVSAGNGYNVFYMPNPISGLVPNVAYHFRLVAANASGTNYGFDQILDEANVAAWGADYVGQTTVPPGLSNVVAIAGASDHSLALGNSGSALAWGQNNFGQATVPATFSNLLAVAGGGSYSLALKNNGTVAVWGANIFPGETNVPAGLSNVVAIASGEYSSLALKNNGTVVAWGPNIFGLTSVPAGLGNAVAVAGGILHSLAIRNDGTVVAWGDNSSGQTNVPANLTNVVAIAAGGSHSLALKYDGTVVAWGDNGDGQTSVPPGLSNVVAIAAGGYHSMALKSDGSLVTWGDASVGQRSVPAGLTNFVAIAAGYFHSLALTPQSIASLTNVVLDLTNGVPQTNSISAGGITYYKTIVPAGADFATNQLLFADAPLNVWFTTNNPPTLATNAYLLLSGTNGVATLDVTSSPTNIVPGATYYLGIQNTNNFTVNYALQVDFHFTTPPPVNIGNIVYTNGGFLLTWFAPSNLLFQVQFTTNLAPANWLTFTNIISYNTNFPASATNAQFNFFDDGVLYPFGPTRFYRLLLLTNAPNTAPVFTLANGTQFFVTPNSTNTVTNSATDSDVPAQILTYALAGAPAWVAINATNGVLVLTPALAQAGTTNLITTIVTDSGTPALSATNLITVLVNPLPVLGSVTLGTNGVTLQWSGWTNEQFQVWWTTNLAPPNWTNFPGIITSTNGQFTFVDTNTSFLTKFYQLILLP
jgi:subtilisin-like proprotein convertase family protein